MSTFTHSTTTSMGNNKLQYDLTLVKDLAHALPAEVEKGHHEYKYTLANITDVQVNHRISQLLWRLRESPQGNEAVYYLGYDDDGTPRGLTAIDLEASLQTLQYMAKMTQCDVQIENILHGQQGYVARLHFYRQLHSIVCKEDLHIAFAGSQNSGKSTLLGVLRTQKLDNGKGLARMQVFNHNHEILTGHTSSISYTTLSFTKKGEIIPNQDEGYSMYNPSPTHATTTQPVHRIVTCIDLAGHVKYLKTTITGILGHTPHYICIHISAMCGIEEMTLEHIALAKYLQVPIAVIITKIDMLVMHTPKAQHHEIIDQKVQDIGQQLEAMLFHDKTMVIMKDKNTLEAFLVNDERKKVVPIFAVSNITGQGMDLLKSFLFLAPHRYSNHVTSIGGCVVRILGVLGARQQHSCARETGDGGEVSTTSVSSGEEEDELGTATDSVVNDELELVPLFSLINPAFSGTLETKTSVEDEEYDEFEDDEMGGTNGITILIGKISSGVLAVGEEMLFGPSSKSGKFIRCVVSSIQRNRQAVSFANAGMTVTISLILAPDSFPASTTMTGTTGAVRGRGSSNNKGLVMVHPSIFPKAFMEFEVKINMLPSTNVVNRLGLTHMPVVHIGHIRQCVRILSIRLIDGEVVEEVVGGQQAYVKLRFLKSPMYLEKGDQIIIREGRTRAVGELMDLLA